MVKKSADNGHVNAQALMGSYELIRGNLNATVEYWEKASEGGHLKAMHDLAVLYRDGDMNAPINKPRAIELFKKAADAGYLETMESLGVCYSTGDGVVQDDYEAFRWFSLATEKGEAFAQKNLGISYRRGIGTVENKTLAIQWFEKAAEQGNIQAKICLADMYAAGEGVAINYYKAETYYRDVIEAGEGDFYDDAIGSLALMYATKINDYYNAFPLWKIAAERGNTTAKYNLGLCYHIAWGTFKDDSQAFYWWRQAGEEGDEDARENAQLLEEEMHSGNKYSGGYQNKALKKMVVVMWQ